MTDSARGPRLTPDSTAPALKLGVFRRCSRLGGLFAAFLLFGAVTAGPFGQTIDDVRRQIESLSDDGFYVQALEMCRRSLSLTSQSPELAVTAVKVALKAGDLDLAGRVIRSSSIYRVSDPDLLVVASELEVRLGDLERARDLLERVCGMRPSDGEAQYRLAKVLFAAGDDEDATSRAQRAVELSPESSRFRHFYASLLARVGQRREALQQLEVAWRLKPDDGRVLLELADQERLAGRMGRAVEYLELAVESDPENPLFYRELAKVERTLGRIEDARSSSALADSLEAAFETLSQSLTLAGQGRLDQAITTLEPAVSQHHEFLTGALTLAGLLQKRGRNQKALRLYEAVLERDPGCRRAREESAWLLVLQGRQEQALETLHSGGDGDSPNENLLRARKRENEGDWERALDDLRRVERRYPLDPTLKQEVSRVLNEAGRPREALANLERAYALSPGNPKIEQEARRIRFEYALDREQQQQWSVAQRILESLVREHRDSLYLFHLAYCLQNQARYREAAALFRQGLDQDPESEWANVNLAFCLYSEGVYDEAASVWEGLVGRARKPQYLYSLGLSRLHQSRPSEGMDLIAEAAASGYPPAVQWMRHAGPVYVR
jgi:tetratricopeptide (TPR) repeat protein